MEWEAKGTAVSKGRVETEKHSQRRKSVGQEKSSTPEISSVAHNILQESYQGLAGCVLGKNAVPPPDWPTVGSNAERNNNSNNQRLCNLTRTSRDHHTAQSPRSPQKTPSAHDYPQNVPYRSYACTCKDARRQRAHRDAACTHNRQAAAGRTREENSRRFIHLWKVVLVRTFALRLPEPLSTFLAASLALEADRFGGRGSGVRISGTEQRAGLQRGV